MTFTFTTRSARPEPVLPKVRVVLPDFNPPRENVALPATTETSVISLLVTTVGSVMARMTSRPSSNGTCGSLDVIVTFF